MTPSPFSVIPDVAFLQIKDLGQTGFRNDETCFEKLRRISASGMTINRLPGTAAHG